MDKKKTVIIFIVVLTMITTVIFSLQKINNKIETNTYSISEPKIDEFGDELLDEEHNEKLENNIENEKEKGQYKIKDNITEIKRIVRRLNSFPNSTTKSYNTVLNDLKKYNITVEDSVKGGFGIYDNLDVVMAGIVKKMTVEEKKNKIIFTLETLTGRSAIVDDDSNYTSREIRKALQKDTRAITVVYELDLKSNGQTGILKRIAGQWW